MSDVQQGPGWWMASDGKWYPPQGEQLPPPPPPGFPQYTNPAGNFSQRTESVSQGLSVWLQVLLYISAGLTAVAALMIPSVISAAQNYDDASSGSSGRAFNDWINAEDRFAAFFGLYILVAIPVFVLLIVFLHRAHKSTQTLWAGHRKWSQGWAVGSWFIPFANFIIVPQVFREIDRIASSPRNAGRVDDGWQRSKGNPQLILWWVFYGVGTILSYVYGATSDGFSSLSDYKAAWYVTMLGVLLSAASCVLAALTVRRMGKALSPSSMGV
jgi:hypothetical protein